MWKKYATVARRSGTRRVTANYLAFRGCGWGESFQALTGLSPPRDSLLQGGDISSEQGRFSAPQCPGHVLLPKRDSGSWLNRVGTVESVDTELSSGPPGCGPCEFDAVAALAEEFEEPAEPGGGRKVTSANCVASPWRFRSATRTPIFRSPAFR